MTFALRRAPLLFVVAGLLLLGCDAFDDDDDEWVTRSIDRELTGEAAVVGECEGVYAGWARLELSGTGEGPPFGESTLTATTCFNPATGAFAEGTGTVVAENGDEADWTFNINANLQTGAFTDSGEFTGGTGRYSDIHGTFTGEGQMELQFDENGQLVFPIPTTESVTGVVTYRD
jgi:hypothetical protein